MNRYHNAYNQISDFLENKKWRSYWRNPNKLIEKMGWELIPYSKETNTDLSNDAYCKYENNKIYILYCKDNYKTRTNFNFHHEVGHIIAGHIYLDNCEIDTNHLLHEREATIIGRIIFLPAYILTYILERISNSIYLKNYLENKYELSSHYIKVRFEYLTEDLENINPPDYIIHEAEKEYQLLKSWYLQNEYNYCYETKTYLETPDFLKKVFSDVKIRTFDEFIQEEMEDYWASIMGESYAL